MALRSLRILLETIDIAGGDETAFIVEEIQPDPRPYQARFLFFPYAFSVVLSDATDCPDGADVSASFKNRASGPMPNDRPRAAPYCYPFFACASRTLACASVDAAKASSSQKRSERSFLKIRDVDESVDEQRRHRSKKHGKPNAHRRIFAKRFAQRGDEARDEQDESDDAGQTGFYPEV